MEVISDCDSLASIDTQDRGFAMIEGGKVLIEEDSSIYTSKCANCYKTFEEDDSTKILKYIYKVRDEQNRLYFCCKGCRLWGLFKLGRNKHRPRLSCVCKSNKVEGLKYVPPTISTPGRKYAVSLYGEFYFIIELPVTLAELFQPLQPERVYRRLRRSRSRSR